MGGTSCPSIYLTRALLAAHLSAHGEYFARYLSTPMMEWSSSPATSVAVMSLGRQIRHFRYRRLNSRHFGILKPRRYRRGQRRAPDSPRPLVGLTT